MERWDETRTFDDEVDACVYGSRLLGADPDLVLHGGGNTSVKAPFYDLTGRSIDALYVKGSGWDLASIERPGLTPLRLERLHELLELDRLSDPDMMRELAAAKLDPTFPAPSVETLLHALLPFQAVQHSHADVIVTLTNLAAGEDCVHEVFGDRVVVVPYVMPGFDLAKAVSRQLGDLADHTIGLVLMNHGLFTFGDETRTAYERHTELIGLAETWLDENAPNTTVAGTLPPVSAVVLAELRRDISAAAGRPMVTTRHTDERTAAFVARDDVASLAGRGPLTPDHVIRTKRVPLVGRDVAQYADDYRRYFAEHEHRARTPLTMLDPAPRVVLDPELGMLTCGPTAKDAAIAADIYQHTMKVLTRAEDHLGGYQALPAGDIFDLEYWDLEQAKLRRSGSPPELQGAVAVVTGAASGIGRACAERLAAGGAAVVGLDIDPDVAESLAGRSSLGIAVDVTDSEAQAAAVTAAVERFGGVDIAVLSAGVFGPIERLARVDASAWRHTMAVNVDAAADLLSRLHPLLQRSPIGGRVAVIGSKNVAAPGTSVAAYSASKAALTQLARVTALEWAADRIRVNVVHPDAVFDTRLWSEELIAERAAAYGLSAEDYKRRNLLGAEVRAEHVARAVVALCSSTFEVTTGAQVPVDGGNERVI